MGYIKRRSRKLQSSRRHFRRNAEKEKLSSDLKEIARLVPQNSPEGQYFQEYMEALIKRLFPRIDLKRKPIDFLIADDLTPNAFCGPSFSPTLIVFNKGLLQKLEYVEDLAGILGHEFTHKKFADRYGTDHLNTKLEEMAGDLWPLVVLYDAGLDPRRHVDYARTLFKGGLPSWYAVFDVHPISSLRVRALETGLALLDKARGGFTQLSPTLLPDKFFETVSGAKHISYLDHYLESSDFQNKDIVEQLNIFNNYWDHIKAQNMGVTTRRCQDFAKRLSKLRIKKSDSRQMAAFDSLVAGFFDKFVMTNPRYRNVVLANEARLYAALSSMFIPGKVRALGRLRKYISIINQFIDANSAAEAHGAAVDCLELINQEPLFQVRPFFAAILDIFETFEMPETVRTQVSWNNHLNWSARDDAIATMLLTLGIADQRIFETLPQQIEQTYLDASLVLLVGVPVLADLNVEAEEEEYEDYDEEEGEEQEVYRQVLDASLADVVIDDRGYIEGFQQALRSYTIEELQRIASSGEGGRLLKMGRDLEEALEEEDEEAKIRALEDVSIRDVAFRKAVKEIEKRFLEITPGDEPAEKRLLQDAAKTIGLDPHTRQIKGPLRAWVALDYAERNFKLFIELNVPTTINMIQDLSIYADPQDSLMEEVRGEDDIEAVYPYILYFVDKLTEMAESGNKEQIKDVKEFLDSLDAVWSYPIFAKPQYILRFILENPGQILSRKEQRRLLLRIASIDSTYNQLFDDPISDQDFNLLRRFLGYKKAPKTGADYLRIQQKLKNLKIENDVLAIELRLLVDEFSESDKALFTDEQLDIFTQNIHDPASLRYGDLEDYFRNALARKESWDFSDLDKSVQQWLNIYHADFFPGDLRLCYQLLRQLLKRIQALKDPAQQQKLYQKFLYSYRIADPKVRNRIYALWVKAIYNQYGLDKGSNDYYKKISRLLVDLKEHLSFIGDVIDISALLADQLQTQQKLTQRIGQIVSSLSKSDLHRTQFRGMAIEAALLAVRNNLRAQQAFIDYLIAPFSREAVEEIYAILNEEIKEIRYTVDYAKKLGESFQIPPERAKAELAFVYENFWALPFIARAALFEFLLFPEGNSRAQEEIFDFVNDSLFPLEQKYSDEARTFIKAYFQVSPDYQHRFLLSAMMVAAEKSNTRELPIGERLSTVLELLGPAETKLGQVIHSHPRTPEDVREGMERLKSRADPPYRWDLFKYYRDAVPSSTRRLVTHIGKLLGSASFFLAFEATLDLGERKVKGRTRRGAFKGVFKIMRPYAEERAENGFKIMQEMLQFLNLQEATIQVLQQMIQQAQKNASIEVDNLIAIEQAKLAVDIYDGRVVILDGEKYNLHVPKIIRYGQHYQFIELAPGQHFNDLPENNQAQMQYKEKLATAYFAFELATILKGRRFDSDRHGAQMRIRKNDIYLFDWGNMLLEPPTDEELSQLGQLLVEIIPSVMTLGAEHIGDALTSALQARIERGEDVEYLLSVQKAFLSLEDFRKYVNQEVLLALIANALKNAHPAITAGIIGKAMELGLDYSMLESFLEQPSPVQIEIKRRRRNPYYNSEFIHWK